LGTQKVAQVLNLCRNLIVPYTGAFCEAVESYVLEPYLAGHDIPEMVLEDESLPVHNLLQYMLPVDHYLPPEPRGPTIPFRDLDDNLMDETDEEMADID
jgi:hypothetical protein